MNKLFKLPALVFALSALVLSCNNNDDDQTADLNAVYNDAASQTAYNDVVSIGDESVIDEDLTSFKIDDIEKISAPCATIILPPDTNAIPNVTTIDFGTVNCLCNDGKNRRGKIKINHPSPSHVRDSGAVFHHEFEDFYVNDNKVLGYVDVTNIGLSPEGFHHFKWDVVGGLELADAAGNITWESHQVKAFLEGFGTPTRLDDKIGIHGTSSGVTQTGETFISQIDSLNPLRQKFEVGCRKHFFAGTANITPQGKPVRILNYGEMTPEICDDSARCTINTMTWTISLNKTHQ